jgi:hypothetical protein
MDALNIGPNMGLNLDAVQGWNIAEAHEESQKMAGMLSRVTCHGKKAASVGQGIENPDSSQFPDSP